MKLKAALAGAILLALVAVQAVAGPQNTYPHATLPLKTNPTTGIPAVQNSGPGGAAQSVQLSDVDIATLARSSLTATDIATAIGYGTTGQVLTSNGNGVAPTFQNATGGSGSPSGSSTNIQYNCTGAFCGSANVAITGPTTGVQGLTISGTDLNAANSTGDLMAAHINCANTGTTSSIGFVDENCAEIDTRVFNQVLAAYAGGTSGKKTFLPLYLNSTFFGGGQRIGLGNIVYCYGASDCATMSNEILAFNTYPINGDEGTGITEQGNIQQQGSLVQLTVVSASKDTCTGTITSTVTASQVAQTVPFTVTSGSCNAGDYVEINAAPPTSTPNYAWMKIVSYTGGNLTGIIPINLTINAPVTPTTTVTVDGTGNLGYVAPDLPAVYLSGSSYSTGSIASVSINTFTMSGATITNSVVGGDSKAIGCFAATADDYSGSPFNGTGTQGTLKSWYEIQSVSSNNPTVFSDTIASSTGLRTYAPGGGTGYIIRPCVRIIVAGADGNQNKLILGTNAFTTPIAGDKLEVAIQPFPDVHGYSVGITDYTAGAFNRYAYDAYIFGPREWQVGYLADGSAHATGGNSDAYGFLIGFQCLSCATGYSVSVGSIGALFSSLSNSGVIVSGSSATGAGFEASLFPIGLKLDANNTHQVVYESAGGGLINVDAPTTANTRNIVWPDASGTVAVSGAAQSFSTVTVTGAAPTVAAGQIGFGAGVAASTSCGSLAGAAGCVIVNVAGTTHYIPYY